MSKITFFRQEREDGGIRTGIELDDRTMLSQFDEGSDEFDPALTWYVDVRFEGPRLPRDAELARKWLIRQTPVVQRELAAMAQQIPTGIDPDYRPILHETKLTNGLRMTIACSAMRRVKAKQLASIIAEIAGSWRNWIEALPAPIPA
jgi:hypothetical protein